MKEIIEIMSARGDYFVIGKRENGYYLKNRFTEIPNEFGMYDINDIKKLFDGLCKCLLGCEEVTAAYGHPNSCAYVIYADKTRMLFHEKEDAQKNVCYYTSKAAYYSEFCWTILGLGMHSSNAIYLERLRWVCQDKTELCDVLYNTIKAYEPDSDDYTDVYERYNAAGELEIYDVVYGQEHVLVTVLPNGKIDKTGGLKFVELMKKHDVTIIGLP